MEAGVKELMEKYKSYPDKILRTYCRFEPEVDDELRQAALVGLWKGVKAYLRKETKGFDHKKFVNTICAYIRYEIADYFKSSHIVKIGSRQWKCFSEANKILKADPAASEEEQRRLLDKSGQSYDMYVKTKGIISPVYLDKEAFDENSTNYNLVRVYDRDMERFIDKEYALYIIDSAFAGISGKRDRSLIKTWIASVYGGEEIGQARLGRLFGLSPSMVNIIINKFIDICRFVRKCDHVFHNHPDGCINFPTAKGKNIPGVRWVSDRRKWRAEISNGKKSTFIGYFDSYEDAVRARRNAEIEYGGKNK